MMKHRLKRAISLLCAFAICVGLLPAGALAVQGPATPTGGINGYQATMQADVITSGGWRDAFVATDIQDAVNIGDTLRSSALNGKIWADKSVVIDNENKEFDVTFSTLGQTFASTETSNEEVAFDVMFVLDRSGSMQTGGRASDAVNAINNAMEALLIGEGTDNNRVGIVTFSDGASTALPLRHYSKLTNWSGEQDFFSYTRVDYRGYWIQAGYENGGQVQEEVSFAGGTYTQSGIANGIDALIGGLNDADADGIERIPVVILLTDGAPTYYNSSYANLANGDRDGYGSSTNGATHGYYTVRTAVSYKQKLADAFAQKYKDSNNTPKFYTIGQGLSGDFAETLLNPTADKIRTAWYSEDEEARSLARALFNRDDSSIDNSFSYADGSYTGEMTQEQLEQIFNEIISSITSITGGEDVGESTGGRDKVTYYDTLGEGVRFTDTMTLRVPKFDQTEDGGLAQGKTDEYQLIAYAAVTIGDIAAGTQMNMKNAPAYLAAGGRIEFRPSSEYQKALEGLNVSVTMLSSGKRQLQVDIPPSLMAYNIINTNTTETTGTTYAYYEAKEPLRLSYSVQMREDVNNAGSYLIGAPAETYVEFYPSSAQDAEGNYEMPYYWPGGQFNNDDTQNKGQAGGQVDKVAGSSDYVYSATKGNNNNVRIYLGNNGLYTLTGKTMNLTVNWGDDSDADGLRPDSVTLQLYVDRDGDGTGSELEPIGESVALPAANGVDDATHNDTLKYTFEGLQVYFQEGDGAVAKYYVAFLGENGQPLTFDAASQNAPYSEYKYK